MEVLCSKNFFEDSKDCSLYFATYYIMGSLPLQNTLKALDLFKIKDKKEAQEEKMEIVDMILIRFGY